MGRIRRSHMNWSGKISTRKFVSTKDKTTMDQSFEVRIYSQDQSDPSMDAPVGTSVLSTSSDDGSRPISDQTADMDYEMSIDDLLNAATQALTARATGKSVESTISRGPMHQNLIQNDNGVAKLNPEVILAETAKSIQAQATEKVSR